MGLGDYHPYPPISFVSQRQTAAKAAFWRGNILKCSLTFGQEHNLKESPGLTVHRNSRFRVSLPFTGKTLTEDFSSVPQPIFIVEEEFILFIQQNNFILLNEVNPCSGSKDPLGFFGQGDVLPFTPQTFESRYRAHLSSDKTHCWLFRYLRFMGVFIPFNGLNLFSESRDPAERFELEKVPFRGSLRFGKAKISLSTEPF